MVPSLAPPPLVPIVTPANNGTHETFNGGDLSAAITAAAAASALETVNSLTSVTGNLFPPPSTAPPHTTSITTNGISKLPGMSGQDKIR